MTNNIKLSARKTSFILAVSCILFSVIATYLYINHQIDLTRYTTPIILGTVVIIITCGGLQRVFYIFLTDECPQIFSDNQRNSIPDKVIPKPDMIIEECSEPTVEVSDIEMIEYAARAGADRVELYTEPYASAYKKNPEEAVAPFVEAAKAVRKLGMGLNAGHDLSLENLEFFHRNIPWLDEVSIGHALICDALYLGLKKTIEEYRKCLE